MNYLILHVHCIKFSEILLSQRINEKKKEKKRNHLQSIIDRQCESSIHSLGGSYHTNLPVLIKLRCFCVIPASLNYCWTTLVTIKSNQIQVLVLDTSVCIKYSVHHWHGLKVANCTFTVINIIASLPTQHFPFSFQ